MIVAVIIVAAVGFFESELLTIRSLALDIIMRMNYFTG